MKHSAHGDILRTNIFQAFHRNKLIQDKLDERQHLYDKELIKNMRSNYLNEQYNRELLYTWKKENYIRQLRKNLQEFNRRPFGVSNVDYESYVRNLNQMITNQQSVIIPLIEDKHRLQINTKVRQFLQNNPLQRTSPVHLVQSEQQDEEVHRVEETHKEIHLASTIDFERRRTQVLPSISGQTHQPVSRSFRLPFAYSKSLILVPSESFQKLTGEDLVAMRSIRRPRRNPVDFNQIFEARKRIYQTNKRVYDDQVCRRRHGLHDM